LKKKSEVDKLVEHFFRHESGKMISVLTGLFGASHISLAEDLVQDAIVEAIRNWTYHGIPDNPSAWLYRVAKNKALNALKRKKYNDKYISDSLMISPRSAELDTADFFTEESISDDQLRMMFICCHPSISRDSQIVLILKTLCGFSIGEIARSFLTNNDNINKRLVRARKKIRTDDLPFVLPAEQELETRVDAVLEAIYLLYNEGYSASIGTKLIREELCNEAIRLVEILVNHRSISDNTSSLALLALMQLNSSRFNAREDENGNIITMARQDRRIWDLHLMERGFSNLKVAAQSQVISKYHILASISAYHCSAKDFKSTDWQGILTMYDRLLELDNSPLIVLNRAIVLSEMGEQKEALKELDIIEHEKVMASNYLFYSAKSKMLSQANKDDLAHKALLKAIELAPLESEKQMLESRLIANYT